MSVNSGDRFGRLTAQKPIAGGKFWECLCDCGNTTKASRWHLEQQKRKSCGCRTKKKEPEITCKKCEITKPREDFYLRPNGNLLEAICKPCKIAIIVEKERQDRFDTLQHYGGKCDCCGESNKEFLAFDHINGDGNKHRKQENIKNLAKWLRQNKYPKGFRVLCHNCNFSIGAYGYCPHQTTKICPDTKLLPNSRHS